MTEMIAPTLTPEVVHIRQALNPWWATGKLRVPPPPYQPRSPGGWSRLFSEENGSSYPTIPCADPPSGLEISTRRVRVPKHLYMTKTLANTGRAKSCSSGQHLGNPPCP